jgi:hypothetical protein
MRKNTNGSPTKQMNPIRPGSISRKGISTLGLIRSRLAETRVRVPVNWLRHRGFRPADVILGCYPRSGSTWLRFTLLEILTGQPSQFETVNRAFRKAGEHAGGLPLLLEGGRLIGTHEAYRSEYKRAIYLMRDVRDVVLSEFAFEKERGVGCANFDEYLSKLLEGKKRYGSWQDHVVSWVDSGLADSGNLQVVRFEDMRRQTEQTLAQILDFLNVRVDRERVREAVQNNSLDRMRIKEDTCSETNFPHRPMKSSTEEGRFVRNGSVEGWRKKLTQAQVELIERHAGNVLARMGYPVGSRADTQAANNVSEVRKPIEGYNEVTH